MDNENGLGSTMTAEQNCAKRELINNCDGYHVSQLFFLLGIYLGVFNVFALLFYVSYVRTIFNNPGTPLKASEPSTSRAISITIIVQDFSFLARRKVVRN